MKSSIYMLTSILSLGLCVSLSLIALETAAPPGIGELPLTASNLVHDFGKVPHGDHAATFELRNTGSAPLIITHIRSSCDCAKVQAPSRPIPPSGSVSLDCVWNTRGKRGKSTTSFEVFFRTTKPDLPAQALTLKLIGDVLPDFTWTPSELIFNEGISHQSVLEFQPGLHDIRITKAHCSHRAFDVNVVEGGRRINVAFRADLWGSTSGSTYLAITTANPGDEIRTIPVRVLARPNAAGEGRP